MKLLETITPEAISALPSGDGQALGYNPTTGTLVRVPSAAAAVAGLAIPSAEVGRFFHISALRSLDDHFTTSDTDAFDLDANGYIECGGLFGTFAHWLRTKWATSDDSLEASIVLKVGMSNVDSYGVSVGLHRSGIYYGYQWHAQIVTSNGADTGNLRLWAGSDPGYGVATIISANLEAYPIVVGSYHRLTIARNGAEVLAVVQNLDTGLTKNVRAVGNLAAVKDLVVPSTSHVVISQLGGIGTVVDLECRSGKQTRPYSIVVSDSKGYGYSAGSIGSRWADVLGISLGKVVDVYAGDGDGTAEALATLSTIRTHVAPKFALLCIGRNDLTSGVAAATWQANYAACVAALTAMGATVLHILPIPEAFDQAALRTWILGNYTATIDPAVGWVSGTMLSADNTHPTAAGHAHVAAACVSSGLLT